MSYRSIITSLVIIAVCTQLVSPALAQTVILPNGQYYGGGISGQTIIVQNTTPVSTYVVQPTVSQPVIVQNVETTYTTNYPSTETVVAAGVTGLIGGVLLGGLWHRHDKKHHYKPAPSHKEHGHNNKHHGGHKSPPKHRR